MTTEAQRIKEGILVQKTRRHLTHAEVAAIIGISPATLSRRFDGSRKWKHEELHRLADAWGVTIQQLEAGFGDNHTTVTSDP